MPEIADILALFGHIDRIAGENRDDPRIEETVHRLLPGTAGYQQGWFTQVERFLQTVSGRDSSPLPNYQTAVQSLGENRIPPEDWQIPQQAKARYAATVLAELQLAVSNGGLRTLTDDPVLADLAKVLAVGTEQDEAGFDFLGLIESESPSHSGWHRFMARAHQEGLVTAEEAALHPPAKGKIRASGDEFCTQLDTPYEDPTLDISKVKHVIDPRNWPGCCPYWKTVKEVLTPPNEAGWTRIYEVVSVAGVTLTTPLIFRNASVGDGIVINYDLDTNRNGSQTDDFVYVDSGYIWVTPINAGKGVRVHTRKVARIQGLGVAALAMYAYAMGWSTAGENLILGCAKKPPAKTVGFTASPKATKATPTPPRTVPPIPKLGVKERQLFVTKVVDALTNAIDERSAKTGELVQHWFDGDLLPSTVKLAGAEAGFAAARTHTNLHTAATQTTPAPEPKPATNAVKEKQKALNKKAAAKKVPPKKVAAKKVPPKVPPKKVPAKKKPVKGKDK